MKKKILINSDDPLYIIHQLQSLIPTGEYCYDENGICPFYEIIKDKDGEDSAFCHYEDVENWILLDDQCKICSINMGSFDEI